MIEWTGSRTYDPDRMCHVFQAKVEGKSISVRISEEAVADRGEAASLAVAARKIVAAMNHDKAPITEILVTNDDFAG
jgi:hypothetical protein